MPKRYFVQSLAFSLAVAAALGGCSQKDGDKAASQVVAKVNGTEISLHQVNHLLTKAGNIQPDQLDRARKSVLERLIDQQLLAAKAVEEKLDRTPETLMAIEVARSEILARARLDQLMAAGPKLTPGDVSKYYVTHPELFAERKIYNLQEIAFPTQKEGITDVQALVTKGAPMADIQEFLKSRNIPGAANAGIRAAEQVPIELLKQLHAAKEGETFLVNSPQGHTVIKVVAIKKAAVDETAARPAIQRFLINQRAAEVTAGELKTLKAAAKIEYLGTLASQAKPDQPQRQDSAPSANLPQLPQLNQLPLDSEAANKAK